MSVTQPLTTPVAELPAGTWRVDPEAGQLTFSARGAWGLAAVRGVFGAYGGELHVDDGDVRGELRIEAASLDTKNRRRDTHLRSADFFHATEYPIVTFSLVELVPSADDTLVLGGTLRIRDNELPVRALATASRPAPDRLQLETNLSVDRAEAGVGWSKLGMVRGPAQLGASVVLVRDES